MKADLGAGPWSGATFGPNPGKRACAGMSVNSLILNHSRFPIHGVTVRAKRSAAFLLMAVSLAILSACGRGFPWKSAASVAGSLQGTLQPWSAGTPIAGRRILLCLSEEDPRNGNCRLMERSTTSDAEGHFYMENVPEGAYFVLYDSGLGDFDAALALWGGQVLHFGDKEWLSNFLGVDPEENWVIHRIPEGLSPSPHESWLTAYCGLTLLVGNSPFIIVHNMEYARDQHKLRCNIVNIQPNQTSTIEAFVVYFGD